ncbi:hypothetical protein BH09PLA1_BH09PLA1_27270 [soil metagenome]
MHQNTRLTTADHVSTKSKFKRRATRDRLASAVMETLELRQLMSYSAGDLDPTFDVGGKVTTDIGGPSRSGATAVVVQSDGKLVVAGTRNYQYAVTRYNTNGTLDNSFGSNGVASVAAGSNGNPSMAIDSAGRIVVVGADYNGSNLDMSVARLNPNGTMDTTFSGDGVVLIDYGDNEYGNSVAIDANNRIVVAGTAYNNFAVSRLNADGTLDSTFAGAGRTGVDFGSYEEARSVAIDHDGRIFITGTTSDKLAVACLNSGGVPDASFSGDGLATFDFGASWDTGDSVAIDAENRVVVGGMMQNEFGVVRVGADGTLDTSFSGDGLATVSFQPDFNGNLIPRASIALDASGRILLTGNGATNSFEADFLAARFNTDGTPDSTFDGDGMTTVDFGAQFDSSNNVASDSSGRAIVVGSSSTSGEMQDSQFALARFDVNGTLDGTFGGGGKTTTVLQGPSQDQGRTTLIQPDGKILVSGNRSNGNGTLDLAITRYNNDGSLDSSFGTGGKATYPFGQGYTDTIALDSLGRILVGFTASNGSGGSSFAVARLNANGSVDTTFGANGIVTIDVSGGGYNACNGIAVDSNGRIVLAGYSDMYPSRFWSVARLNSNGSLDNTFSGDGKDTLWLGTANAYANAVTVDSQNRIILAGHVNGDFAAVRYSANGTLDTSFSGDGIATIDMGTNGDIATAVTMYGDRILLSGGAITGVYNYELARLSADGIPDNTFSGDGKFSMGGFGLLPGNSVAVDSVGRIAMAGTVFGGPLRMAALRFTADGNLDNSFSGDGIAPVDFGGYGDVGSFVTFDSQDRVVVGGFSDGADRDFAIARLRGDASGITVTPTSGLATSEAGATATFSVVLSTQPTSNVTVALSTSDSTEGTINKSSLVFTPGNWKTPQVVTITGQDDSNYDGNIAYTIVTAPATSTDADYSGANAADVSVTNADNETKPALTTDPTDATKTALVVNGTGANDLITVFASGSQVQVIIRQGTSTVFSQSFAKPTGKLIVNALDGNDVIIVDPAITNTQLLYAGAGNDIVYTSNGTAVVLGGDGNDALYAGSGRGLLIGGNGTDLLLGANGDDILIGGTTSYDAFNTANQIALSKILSEWSGSASYATRVNHLTGTSGGLNASFFLKATAGATQTVFDDAAKDSLSGGDGQDWFFAKTSGSFADSTDKKSNETLTLLP